MSSVSATAALSDAFTRLDRAGADLVAATSGASDADAGAAVAEMVQAKAQARATMSVVRFSDEMFKALLDIANKG